MFYQNQTAAATGQQPTGTQQQQQSQTQVVQQQAQQQQQQQPGMDNTYTYSASQTQTINFTQQHLRANTRMPASLSVQQQAAQQQQQAMQQQQAAQQQQVKRDCRFERMLSASVLSLNVFTGHDANADDAAATTTCPTAATATGNDTSSTSRLQNANDGRWWRNRNTRSGRCCT
jgi:hypothetical protein